MKNSIKLKIPNVLTMVRIICTPIIIILGIMGKIKMVLLLVIISSLTDLFDGKLARKWNVVSELGAKLDAFADKIFAIGLTSSLVTHIKLMPIILLLEISIGISNYYYYKKTNITRSLMVGKIKTTFLFVTIIISMISILIREIVFLREGFIFASINLQILCLIFYFNQYKRDKNIVIAREESKKEIYDYELGKTKKIENLNDLMNELSEKED